MRDLKADFEEFHKENPHVYNLFESFTFQVIHAGRKDFGAKAIVERMRWFALVETKGDIFKINNNHTSFYARMFVDHHPEYFGLFQMRKAQADKGASDGNLYAQ